MFPFRRIAFPVDFSERCGAAVPYVREMVSHFKADLLLVHAFEYPLWQEHLEPLEPHPRSIELQRLHDFAKDKFKGVRSEILVVEGEPGTAISCGVQRFGADLVMLPTHGHGTFRRFLIGSVATKLLHDLDCPVWTGVHTALEEHQPGFPYRSIVCAVDIDDSALSVAKAAAAFSESYGAKLSLVHVVDTPPMALEVDFSPFRGQLIDIADRRLREIRDWANIDADVAVLEGSVASRIRSEVLEHHADLVILGRGHARGGLSRIGSHLYRIVRESPCPVLSF